MKLQYLRPGWCPRRRSHRHPQSHRRRTPGCLHAGKCLQGFRVAIGHYLTFPCWRTCIQTTNRLSTLGMQDRPRPPRKIVRVVQIKVLCSESSFQSLKSYSILETQRYFTIAHFTEKVKLLPKLLFSGINYFIVLNFESQFYWIFETQSIQKKIIFDAILKSEMSL